MSAAHAKIDVHTHVLPKDLPDFGKRFGYGGFLRLEHVDQGCARLLRDDGSLFRTLAPNCWDAAARLRECDDMGVRLQVLSTLPVLFSYWAKPQDGLVLAQVLNDYIAGLVRDRPDRFAGLGTLPLQDGELAARELERCVRTLGLRGAQIGTHVNGRNLDDGALDPVFAAAQELDAAIFVHPWDMLGADRMKKYWMPWLVGMPAETSLAMCSVIFGGVLERYPRLRLGFAHGGGAFPGIFGRIAHGFDCRPDLVAVDNPVHPSKYLSRLYVDSLVHDADMLRFIVKLFGPERVMLGSDYPFPLGEDRPGTLAEAALPADVQPQVLADNARTFLGLAKT